MFQSWQQSKGISTERESGPKTLPYDLSDVLFLDANLLVAKLIFSIPQGMEDAKKP